MGFEGYWNPSAKSWERWKTAGHCWRAAEQLNPDIILLDISMPLLNGVDAARRLRDAVPKTALPWRRTTIGSTASTRPRPTRI
jgi:CheY-like chemotaxis protein